jgi:hypothetical protein
MGVVYILKLIYTPYNFKLRLSLCFFVYFFFAFCTRLFFTSQWVTSVLIFCFMCSIVFWFSVFPGFFVKLTVYFCKSVECIYKYFLKKNIFVGKHLNLIYNFRNVLTRGHPRVLLFYNITLTILFIVNFLPLNFLRTALSTFFIMGSVIDILHQCFMFYGYIGWDDYKGKWRDRYRYLEWDNKQSLLRQVRYNQIVLQRINYMFEDVHLPFYSRRILMYGFRPAYRLDRVLNKVFSKKKENG